MIGLRLAFMPLHHGAGAYVRVEIPHHPIEPVLNTNSHTIHAIASNLLNKDFAFFLQCHLPQARRHAYKTMSYLEEPISNRLLQLGEHAARGSQSLWQELLTVEKQYRTLGKPRRETFRFAV